MDSPPGSRGFALAGYYRDSGRVVVLPVPHLGSCESINLGVTPPTSSGRQGVVLPVPHLGS